MSADEQTADYKRIPVAEAQHLSALYGKDVVLVIAIDDHFRHFQFTTFGVRPEAKVRAARLIEEFSLFLECPQDTAKVYEDFRDNATFAVNKAALDLVLAVLQSEKAKHIADGTYPQGMGIFADLENKIIKAVGGERTP